MEPKLRLLSLKADHTRKLRNLQNLSDRMIHAPESNFNKSLLLQKQGPSFLCVGGVGGTIKRTISPTSIYVANSITRKTKMNSTS